MIHPQEASILKQVCEQNKKRNLLKIERFYAVLYDEKRSVVEFACLVERERGEVELGETNKQRDYKGIDALPDRVIATKKALRIANFETWLAKDEAPNYGDFEGVPLSWMGIPLFIGDNVIGVIVVENFSLNNAYGADEERLLATMAGQIANALHNARAYRQLRELNTEIVKKEEIINKAFIARDFLHGINNLVGTIPPWIDLIRDELCSDPRDERLKEYLVYIETDIRNLLDMAIEFKKPIQEEKINIKDLLKAVLDHVKIQYPDIECIQKFSSELYPVKASSFQLSNIIDSLLTNAVESMPDGGTLTVKAFNADGASNNRRITVQIEDTGVGVPQEKIANVFDPFYTTKGPERGYGLWRSKSYIETVMGGTIQLNSEVNVGTTVIITLPAVSP
jgi:signal transduction histidine kinase